LEKNDSSLQFHLQLPYSQLGYQATYLYSI